MKLLKQTLSLLLTIAALTVGQSAWAANTWTISSSTSGTYTTFTISRSGDTSKSETVLYRFVGLSAYAGRHFVVAQINGGDIATSQQMSALSGTFTFAATETSKTVTIEEMTASNDAYIFQNGTSRSYKLEVTDQGGFLLKDYTRSFDTGISVPSSGAFNVKDITIRSGEISVTDAGYAQGYHSMTIDNYFNNAAPKAYFQQVGAQLRMTLTFQCKEVNDGWQYVQIYANQSTSNIDTGAGGGDPGNCSYAKYVAGFEHKDSNADTEYKSYTFPVTSANNNEGATNPWGHGSGYNLHKQIFNNSRASDGRLIIPLDLSSLYVRYNASGSDKDDWVAKNTVAHIQAVDATAPTALDISVAPGYHAKGNTVYVSVAFKEIVTSSNAKLNTNWGTLSYNTGSGSNVLTFKGTIGNSATGSLNITGYSGTITDLAANNFAGTITGSNLCTLDASYAYTINYDLDGGSVATANPTTYTYETATFTLNNPTRTGYTFDGWTGSNGTTASTDVQIAQYSHGDKSYTANWTANTYSVHFDANGGSSEMDDQAFTYDTAQNLTANAFTAATGYVFAGWNTQPGGNGTAYTDGQEVINLTATDGGTVDLYAQWTDVWGIAGGANGTEEHPYVITTTAGLDLLAQNVNSGSNEYPNIYFKLGADIAYPHTTDWNDANSTEDNYTAIGHLSKAFCGIFDGDGHTVSGIRINKPSNEYQGLFGRIYGATVKNVTLNDARITGYLYVGGISGLMNYAIIENCLVLNTAITANNASNDACGAVVGYMLDETLNNNHYRNCTVNGTANTTNVGTKFGDVDGVRSVHALTLPDGVTATGESVAIGGTTYYASNTTVTLSYTGTAPEGYIFVGLQVKDADNNDIAVTDNGDGTYTFTMPAADATVPSALVDVWGIAGGANGTEEHPYVITTTAGLDLLATKVNNGSNYLNKYFKLGADIAYDPTALDANGENYTAIGGYHNGYKYFKGTFDGDGHTVSGIRINKTGSDTADRSQGLFGYLFYGTVQNVILDDAHITGLNQVGGITGDMYSATITNCLVLNTAITATANGANNAGIISGYYSSSGTLTANYYHNCTLTKGGTTSTTNIGSGQNSVSDRDGARSVHALTLPDGVTAAGESVAIGSTTYYASNTTVTLSLPIIGYILTDVTVNGTPATDNGDRTWSFTMPAADASVSATISEDPNSLVAIVNYGSITTGYYISNIDTTAAAALNAALNAAAEVSGSTVTLLKNVDLGANDYINCYSGSYTLDLNGHSITGAYSDDVLFIRANITIIDSSTAKTGTITNSGSGSAVYVQSGTCTINGCTISSESERGTVYINGNGQVTIDSCTVINSGSSIAVYYHNNVNTIECNISNSTISANNGTGIIHSRGRLILAGCDISGNIGIRKGTPQNTNSTFTLKATDCTIAGTSYGILREEIQGGTVYLTRCTVSGNIGLALQAYNNSNQYFKDTTIKGCATAGITVTNTLNIYGLPSFGTGTDANGCDIIFSPDRYFNFSSTTNPQTAEYSYAVPSTPITVRKADFDRDTGEITDYNGGFENLSLADYCQRVKYPTGHANAGQTIPIEELFVSADPAYIVREVVTGQLNSSLACLSKIMVLADNADNPTPSQYIKDRDYPVSMQGRTLWKDGYWNTLCVPFGITDISDSPLAGAEIRSLESASLDDEGLLTLNFSDPVTTLIAGTPYIIKWSPAQAENLVNPLFLNAQPNWDNTNNFTSTDGKVQFLGTYAPINFTPGDKSILFMGEENTLYYPASGAYVNACRAYFKLSDPNAQVKNFAFSFANGDDDDPTGVLSQESRVNRQESTVNDLWYDLNGRRLTNKPTRPGIYIHNGKKELLK
ncbi:MAG: InlB B-repeat-containing protein [Bacteroidaceae bacterium]|nr:InlB B-repeat-containing protein [Bacteroidaceae bacterium]